MNHPTFDANGYPTEETLQAIREWPASDLDALFAFMREAWYYPNYWTQDGRAHSVSTGGWSGNESLIDALGENAVVWILCWRKSERGGHYVFEVPEVKP